MARAEPTIAWIDDTATEADPVPLRLSHEGAWSRSRGVALSVLAHVGLVALIAGLGAAERDWDQEPVLEVAIITAPEERPADDTAQPAVVPAQAAEAPPAPASPPHSASVPPVDAEPTPAAQPEPPVEAQPEAKPVELAPAVKAEPAAVEPKPPPKPERPKPVAKPSAPPQPPSAPSPPAASPQLADRATPPVERPAAGREGSVSSRPTESGAMANATVLVRPDPEYPLIARQLREEGTVFVTVEISAAGLPTTIKILRSSGFGSLDQAAVKALEKWRFKPATRDGQPVASTVEIPVRFRMRSAGAGG